MVEPLLLLEERKVIRVATAFLLELSIFAEFVDTS